VPGRPTSSPSSYSSSGRSSSGRGSSSGYRGRSRSGGSSRPSRPPVASDLELALDAAADVAAAETAAAETGADAATFGSLGLPDRLVSALARRDLHAPFAIQTRSIPDALAGRDVLGRGATGSGKTLAFGLPMLTRLVGGERLRGLPRGLVLVPTRELAQQVHDALAPLAQALDLKVMSIYGGASMGRQIDQLRRGADVVVATPGRLKDLIEQRECALSAVTVTGARRGRPHGRPRLPARGHRAAAADRPVVPAPAVLRHARPRRRQARAAVPQGAGDPRRRDRGQQGDHDGPPVWAVQHDAKTDIAAEVASRPGRTLIFVRTKHGADRLAISLRKSGVEAGAIHGNLTQHARKRALEDFSSGHARVLVATDVAARGIHVDDVDLVVHYDPPADHKDYLHRSGRTARAGASGTVLSLVTSDQVREHQRLRERAGVEASALTVVPGHPAVREVAVSGEPIVVAPRPAYVPRPQGERRSTGYGRPRRPPRAHRRAAPVRPARPSSSRSDGRSLVGPAVGVGRV
jgi:superfamily II DNA/RNA helicase